MTLSEKLQTLRKTAGLSQEQLAEQLNVTRQAVSKWETGEGKPDIDNLLPLARLLQTTVDYLLDDEANQPRAEEPDAETPPRTESVGRELWEQLKTFGRRWGWLGGYAIAAIGAVRLITTAIVLFAGGTLLGDFLSMSFGIATGFGLAYYAIGIVQLAVYAAMIVGGLWLAKWLKRKYHV